jgi:cell division protein ZapA
MADVRLNIAGRFYDVSTSDGQEKHLTALAAVVDQKARAIVGTTEVRQLLFASLMLADEVHESGSAAAKPDPEAAPREAALQAELALSAEKIEALSKAAAQHAAALESALHAANAANAETELLRTELTEALARPKANPAHSHALSSLADRIESLADKFEQLV